MSSSSSVGKVWFVTGASAGLGQAVLEALLAQTPEADVVIAGVRRPEELRAILNVAKPYNPEKLQVVHLDLDDEKTFAPIWDSVDKQYGRVDCIIACAGPGGDVSEIEGLPRERIDEFYRVNFHGTFRLLQGAVDKFRHKGGFRMFQVTSEVAIYPYPAMAWYGSSKAALENLLGAWSKELAPEWNMKIHCIALGAFATRMSANLIYHPVHPAYVGTPMDVVIRPACSGLDWAPAPRGAQDILDLAMGKFGDDLPFHIPVGADAAVMMGMQREEYEKGVKFFEKTIGARDIKN